MEFQRLALKNPINLKIMCDAYRNWVDWATSPGTIQNLKNLSLLRNYNKNKKTTTKI